MNTIICLTQPILILLKSKLASQLDIFKKTESPSSSLTASCLPEIEFNLDNRTYRLLYRFLSMDQPELEENYGDLCDLVRAIENGDVEMARKLAQQHVKRFNQYMKKREDASASG